MKLKLKVLLQTLFNLGSRMICTALIVGIFETYLCEGLVHFVIQFTNTVPHFPFILSPLPEEDIFASMYCSNMEFVYSICASVQEEGYIFDNK